MERTKAAEAEADVKWFFLFFMRGIAIGGPYETEGECLAALKIQIEAPIMDQAFDRATASGLCFQGSRP